VGMDSPDDESIEKCEGDESKQGKPSWLLSLKRSFGGKKKKVGNMTSTHSGPTLALATSPLTRRLNKSDWDLGDDAKVFSESVPCLELAKLSLTNIEGCLSGGDSMVSTDLRNYYTIDAKRLASRHKTNQHDKQLMYGVKQFNLDPQKGLHYLQEKNILQSTPESIALFLFSQDRLSKKAIGTYLGGRDHLQSAVLSKFVSLHQFSDLLLVQALRQFLWSFRLPGEAQQIDRVMSSFAEHYCQQNQGMFSNRDTVYILSFAIIMLNTALHNKNVKVKITVEQFIAQNKGIDSGKDLQKGMLEAIYRNIHEQPFKIPDETYDDLMFTFFNPDREGWLMKQGGSWKSWKRRWFVLSDRCLYYFQHTAETSPKGIIPLENVRVRPVSGEGDKQWQFEIINISQHRDTVKGCKTDKAGTVVVGNHKVYRMVAASEEERNYWVKCLEESIKDNPVHRFIIERKEMLKQNCSS